MIDNTVKINVTNIILCIFSVLLFSTFEASKLHDLLSEYFITKKGKIGGLLKSNTCKLNNLNFKNTTNIMKHVYKLW